MYGVLIWAWVKIDPERGARLRAARPSRREKIRLVFVDVIPMVAIIVFSVVIMLVGWCTPTEAAALGALSVIVLAACYGDMTWKAFSQVARRRAARHGDGVPRHLRLRHLRAGARLHRRLERPDQWATSLPRHPDRQCCCIMIGVIIFLGSFMDPLSKMLLTAPIFFPLAKSLGFDLTWFGLIMLLALEIGYTTPPFGLLLFVMKGVAPPGTTMKDIYLAGMPFIACVIALIVPIIFFPPLATWLPEISH